MNFGKFTENNEIHVSVFKKQTHKNVSDITGCTRPERD